MSYKEFLCTGTRGYSELPINAGETYTCIYWCVKLIPWPSMERLLHIKLEMASHDEKPSFFVDAFYKQLHCKGNRPPILYWIWIEPKLELNWT